MRLLLNRWVLKREAIVGIFYSNLEVRISYGAEPASNPPAGWSDELMPPVKTQSRRGRNISWGISATSADVTVHRTCNSVCVRAVTLNSLLNFTLYSLNYSLARFVYVVDRSCHFLHDCCFLEEAHQLFFYNNVEEVFEIYFLFLLISPKEDTLSYLELLSTYSSYMYM